MDSMNCVRINIVNGNPSIYCECHAFCFEFPDAVYEDVDIKMAAMQTLKRQIVY